ncbi:Ubiquitin carboxyl-terminal hydrolase [Spathaspora sp. JA1]|nr:Ubiquitin carboxyl-terminal hydrolase [Spathaspora sp. JA1]
MSTSRPSRFRGDAASFSPSQNHHTYQPYQTYPPQQPNLQQQQQQHQQQQQQVPPHHHQPIPVQYLPEQQQHQQQMYMQYTPGYPMMINPMFAPPPQLYVPMYPQDMYYPQPPQPTYGIPPQQQQQQQHPQQNMPFSPPYHQRKPVPNKRTPSYNNNNNRFASSSSPKPNIKSSTTESIASTNTPSPVVKKDEISTPPTAKSASICTTTPSTPGTTPASKTNSQDITNEAEPEPREEIAKEDDVADEEEQKEDELIKYPLCINTSVDEFTNSYGLVKETRLVDDLNKNNKLRLVFEKLHDRLVVNTNLMKVVDYNTNTSVITNGRLPQQPEPKETPSSTTTTIEQEKQAVPESPSIGTPTSNWASFLQTSARPVSNGVTKKHTKSKSITKPIPKPIPPVALTTTATTASTTATPPPTASTPDFNINNESAQPLGILLLRIMFDSNYSILNESKLPLFSIKPRGLANTGNICYMNSILQILLYCEPFNRLLKLINDKSIGNLGNSPTPMLDATIKLFNQFKQETNTQEEEDDPSKIIPPISPDEFYSSLTSQSKFSHLKWGQQEDAEEFLGYYLDGLNDEFLTVLKKLSTSMIDSLIQHYSLDNDQEATNRFKYNVKTTIKKVRNEKSKESEESETEDDDEEGEWNEVGPRKKIHVKRTVEVEPTPLNMIFGGQFKSVLTIPKSSTSFQKSITVDPFQHVQLDISDDANTIEGALEHLNKVEIISYKSSSNKDIQIKKQTFLDKLPPILIIHLKRFSYSNQDVSIEKLKKRIDYNHDLVIPKEVLTNNNNIKYRLSSVVYHHGSSADAGHYTTDVYKSDDLQWWRIDDANFKQIKNDDVQNDGCDDIKNAYILLYKKV